MHILFIFAQTYPTEDNRSMNMFIHDQVLAFLGKGHKVGVLVPNYPHPSRIFNGKFKFKEAISNYIIDGVPVFNFLFLPIPFIHNSTTELIISHCFTQYSKLYGVPDLIHAQFLWYGGIIANLLEKATNIPFVVTCHSSEFLKEKISRYKYSESIKVLKNAKRIIAVSHFLGERISKLFKLNDVTIIPNTIDNDRFPACQSHLDIKNHFVVTSIGNLLINKGFNNLLVAFQSIDNDHMILNIVGQGPQRTELEKLAKELGISEKVVFHGLLTSDKLVEVLRKTNVVVSASRIETFGMTIIEALSCGIPVLATRSGGPEEIINQTNGILITENTPNQLAQGLNTIYNNYNNYEPKKIRQDCIQKYGKKTFVTQLEKVYIDVLT